MLSLGVLGELLLVFLEYEVAELTALARVPLEMYPFLAAAHISVNLKSCRAKLFLLISI